MKIQIGMIHVAILAFLTSQAMAQNENYEDYFRDQLESRNINELVRIIERPIYFLDREERNIIQSLLLNELEVLPQEEVIIRRDIARALFVLFQSDSRIMQIASREGVDFNRLSTSYQNDNASDSILGLISEDPTSAIKMILHQRDSIKLSVEDGALVEAALLDFVRPIPASLTLINRDAYLALSAIFPDNADYRDRANLYSLRTDERLRWIRDNHRSEVDEFTRAESIYHPSQPFFADTRPYVTVFLVRRGQRIDANLEVLYTSNSWLFIESAEVTFDGRDEILPLYNWSRDNDTEIWEWSTALVAENLKSTLLAISASRSATVRFRSDSTFRDVAVSNIDKQIIHDMLLLWESGILLE